MRNHYSAKVQYITVSLKVFIQVLTVKLIICKAAIAADVLKEPSETPSYSEAVNNRLMKTSALPTYSEAVNNELKLSGKMKTSALPTYSEAVSNELKLSGKMKTSALPTYSEAVSNELKLSSNKPKQHECKTYSLNFKLTGKVSSICNIFFRESVHHNFIFNCSALDVLTCDNSESKDVLLHLNADGKVKTLHLRIDEHDCEYQLTLHGKQKLKDRLLGINKSLLATLQKSLNSGSFRSELTYCYIKTYANIYAFLCYPPRATIKTYDDVSLLEVFIGKHRQLAEHLKFDAERVRALEDELKNSADIIYQLMSEYFRKNKLTWQQFFDVLSSFPEIEYEREFHRAARMLGVALPQSWKPYGDTPISRRPVDLNTIHHIVVETPDSSGCQLICMIKHLSDHCISFALKLGLNMRELELCQRQCYGSCGGWGTTLRSWNRGLVLNIIRFYKDKRQLNWEGLLRTLDTIPEIAELSDYLKFKKIFLPSAKAEQFKLSLAQVQSEKQVEPADCCALDLNGKPFNVLKKIQKYEIFHQLCLKLDIDKKQLWEVELPNRIDEQAVARLIEIKSRTEKFTWRTFTDVLKEMHLDDKDPEISELCELCEDDGNTV